MMAEASIAPFSDFIGASPNGANLTSPIEGSVGSQVSSGLYEVRGDQIASAGVLEIETLPFLGRDGYIGARIATMISAFPKTGKTTLLTALVREWAAAGHRVVVFTEEPEIAWQLRLVAGESETWANVCFVFALNSEPSELYERAFTGTEPIVLIDTLRSCLGFRDETDNSEIARVVNPWIASAREASKTLIGLHHETKAGGEHGRGIAGGHALFGAFDTAIEILRVPESPTRRRVRTYARFLNPPDLLYDRRDDGELMSLGESSLVERAEVRRRVFEVLGEEWLKTREVLEALDEPRPGLETVRSVLIDLIRDGEVERDPAADKRGATYRYRSLTNLTSQRPSIRGSQVLQLTEQAP